MKKISATPSQPMLARSAIAMALCAAFALPTATWAACTPASPMTTASGTVTCSGPTAGEYVINAADVQFTNDSTGAMTLTGSSDGLVFATGAANNVLVTNQGTIDWTDALFLNPASGAGTRATARLGFSSADVLTQAKFVNELGATLSLSTTDTSFRDIELAALAIGAKGVAGIAEVENHGTITATQSATADGVAVEAVYALANNILATNTGALQVTSSANSNLANGMGLYTTSAATAGGSIATNSGTIAVSHSNTTSTTSSVGIVNYGLTTSRIDNSGSITVTSASPTASEVGGLYSGSYANGTGTIQIDNAASGTVVVDSPASIVYAASVGARNNNTPTTITNSGLLEIKSLATAPLDASGRAAVRISPAANVLTALQTINNTATGTIQADSYSQAILALGNAPVLVNNAGDIAGDVTLGAGDDKLIHTAGRIYGNINMGAGNDTMIASGGSIYSSILMGDGNDSLTLEGPVSVDGAATLDGGNGTNDILTINGLTMNGFTKDVSSATLVNNLKNWNQLILNTSTLYLYSTLFEPGALVPATVEVNIGSTLDVTPNSTEPEKTINGNVRLYDGTFTQANGETDNITTVTGNWSAACGLATPGCDDIYALDTSLGADDSATDKLVIKGNTSGTTVLNVNNVGGTGALTSAGILVVQVLGNSNGEFVLPSPGYLDEGGFRYRLVKAGKNWYLHSGPNAPAVGGPGATPVPALDGAGLLLTTAGLGWMAALLARRRKAAAKPGQ